MSTITIVTVAGGGNVPPAEAIARELIARGHGVHVLGQEHQRSLFEAVGADFTETRMRALVARVFASSDQGGAS